jgi:uncharacterized protein YuzB (UPF0349 family)
MKIQICKKFSKVSKLQKKLTEAFPDDATIIKKCISMCKACKTQPVAKVAGKKLTAKNISKIIDKIVDH